MKLLLLFFASLTLAITTSTAQQLDYSSLSIPAELKDNSNAIVRHNDVLITIGSQRNLSVKTKRVVTVLNELGVSDVDAFENYDTNKKVRKIEATVYDSFGREIKSFKRKDFRDQSVGDGFSIFSDNRVIYLNYTPISYPVTIVFESEIETSNTAFIPSWFPLEGYWVSTENATLTINYSPNLGFKYKEVNFLPKYNVFKTESNGSFSYVAKNIKALKNENSSPVFSKIAPVAYFSVQKFNLEGVDGEASTWEEFGKWYYKSILTGTDELSDETQNKIKQLVGDEKDPIKIAKIVYKYVQDKTRYVSIQVGIGGFKPMLAKDVDKLGYGDCKALTNYTRALLNVVGVESFYTIVNAGRDDRKDMQADFVSVQGNHIILAVPSNDKLTWLECTNQQIPFGFQGTFTDDRNVLLIKPSGGQIVRTSSFLEEVNSQITNGKYLIGSDGNLKGNLSILSKGSQYDHSYVRERFSAEEQEQFYKDYFTNINNLKLDKINFKNDRESIIFTQNLELSAPAYASKTGDKMLFILNAFNINSNTPKRYRNRENPFEVNRGYTDIDEITITLPEGYEVEALPQDFSVKNKYGEYQTSIVKSNANTLIYKRTMLIKNGIYENKEYDDYRLFREQIAKNDNSKVVLNKKV